MAEPQCYIHLVPVPIPIPIPTALVIVQTVLFQWTIRIKGLSVVDDKAVLICNTVADSFTLCYICKQEGHWKNECPLTD